MKTIKVDTLEKVFKRIIDKLKFEDVTEVEIPYDFYRIIPTDNWEVGNSDESEIDNIGSLTDDLEYIERLADDEKSICTYVDFDRIASLLRIISEVRNPPQENL